METYTQTKEQSPTKGSCVKADDRREITRVLDDLFSVINRYEGLVDRMAGRLSTVVTCSPPDCPKAEDPGYQTELASVINSARCRLRNTTDALESLYERIEL